MTKRKNPKDLLKRGRKSVITPEILAKLEQAFKLGECDEDACDYAGIGTTALYNYQLSNPKFTEQKRAWKKNPTHKARLTMFRNLDDPKWASWWLERKEKDEFSTMQKVDNAVTLNTTPIVTNSELLEIMERRANERNRPQQASD